MAKQPKKFRDSHEPCFNILAKEIARAIARNKNNKSQKEQFEELITAEQLFRQTLLSYRISTEMYKKFISLIRISNNNILSARPYFRESSKTFSSKITPALKNKDPEAMKEFGINYHMVIFFRDNWIGLWPKKLEALFQRIDGARTILVENNLPLAVNRAKIFLRKNPKGHLSFLDMIEVSAMGLCAAIDKYSGPYLKNFCGVIIGRSVGNLIDANCETVFHFYPNDKRVLYRANSIRGRQGITDITELTSAVNASFAADLLEGKTAPKPVTVTDLAYLMSAASLISSDSNTGEEGFGVYSYTPDSTESVETVLGKKQEMSELSRLARKLPLINQKVLRLKGIEI